MNIRVKPVLAALLILTGVSLSGFAQQLELSELQEGAAAFSKELAKSLPLNSALGLNWSDAYIGKLFPSFPPHFGVGGTFGITTMNMPVLRTLADNLGYRMPLDTSKMFLPAYTLEARVGGLFSPFDVGFKYGHLPPLGLWGQNFTMNYTLLGGDIRYALVDGKSNPLYPNVSFSVGFNYLKSGIGSKIKADQSFSYDSETITIAAPEMNLEWACKSLDFKFQLSKSILAITPYAGLGGSYAWSSAGYSIKGAVTGDTSGIREYLNSLGLDGIDVFDNEMSSIIKKSAFSLRIFGGFSVNLMVLRLDFTVLYSVRDGNYGGSLGFRVQI